MANRKVIVGPYQIGFLAGLNQVLNDASFVSEKAEIDINGLFYACMIQAGVEKFESVGGLPFSSGSDFLQSRISKLSVKKWSKAYERIDISIDKFFPDDYEKDRKYSSISELKNFLLDLTLAVERKSSVVLMSPLPNISNFKSIMPPELFYSLRSLMSSFESETANLPIPKDYLSPEYFNRFQSVICSDTFSRYSLKHQKFEDGRILKIDAKREVEISGREVTSANKNLLRIKHLTVSMIPISSKVIDTIFGKLPGVLAEFFGQQLSNWLKDDRRIVIYQFDPIRKELLSERVKALIEKDAQR